MTDDQSFHVLDTGGFGHIASVCQNPATCPGVTRETKWRTGMRNPFNEHPGLHDGPIPGVHLRYAGDPLQVADAKQAAHERLNPPDRYRHQGYVTIAAYDLINVLRDGASFGGAIPDDAKVIGVEWNVSRQVAKIYLEHPSLPAVHSGADIPPCRWQPRSHDLIPEAHRG